MSTSKQPTIVLPRLPAESTPAYAARVCYITAGPDRNLRAVAQQLHKSLTIIGRWSSRHEWVTSAHAYDEACAALAAQSSAASFCAEVARYRKRYGELGKALYTVAERLLQRLNASVETLAVEPATLTVISRAVLIAADLEAVCLQLDQVIERTESESS
jgi:hypothetical protein